MNSSFIPSFHLINPEKKDKEWAMQVINQYFYNCRNYNLLWNKNIVDIEGYANGNFPLEKFYKMFKSDRKKIMENPNFIQSGNNAVGIEYRQVDMISEKIDSATAIIQKIPIEISCTATDPLAIEKKKSDINFLKNKPAIEEDLQVVADRLNLGKVDLGTTKNSSIEFSDSPFGLDLNNPEELDIFVNILYSLKIETAFETVLEYFYDLKKVSNIKLLEIKDQFKYGVSVHQAYRNDLTGLPDIDYVYAGEMSVPFSRLPDFSDNSHRIRDTFLTPLQLFDRFGSEIGTEEDLLLLINGSKIEGGYCACNGLNAVPYGNFDTFKICLKYVEVKTVDWIGVQQKKKSKYKSFTTDPEKATEKLWVQNTYCFWWLQNTRKVFGIKKLPFSHREKGKESYQSFSTNIYKSQEKSAVERAIGENEKAQIADIKLQHTLIKSLPAGRYIDIRFLRGAMEGLKDESNQWNMERLLTMALEQNVVLGDSEGFDGKNDGQFLAVKDLPGGLKSEIIGYMNIIAAANINISRITGVNQQLTGAGANEEGLVGLQKLLINASINALNYCNEAIGVQYQNLFTIWANYIQQAIAEGGKTKQALIDIIGSKKVNVIDGLDDVPLHDIGVFIKIKQREEERQLFRNKMTQLESAGVITATDEYLLNNINNPKDQWAILAVKEQQFKKRQDQIRQETFANQQQLMQQQGKNMVAASEKEIEGDLKKIYAKGEVEAQIVQLASQLGMNQLQLEGLLKKQLQVDRNKAQTQKNIDTLVAKSNLHNQNAIPA